MRLIIRLSAEETQTRKEAYEKNPDEFTDVLTGDLAEEIWNMDFDTSKVEGIDLEDSNGEYLYTIVGEDRPE